MKKVKTARIYADIDAVLHHRLKMSALERNLTKKAYLEKMIDIFMKSGSLKKLLE